MTHRITPILAAAALATALWNAPALAQDAVTGARIAATWCVACHVIGDERRGTDVAPAFADLATSRTSDEIRGFLVNPHGAMPNIQLERRQIEDVVAYIGSLK